ncbi:MAG TPA: TIGR03619 family F420-dependent LLM class oxidoreductase [Actinomycetota bacterium]|nr:TIGR03619 family F420-dependent LLM class oxidoreductase [Actinomycetota bacterium]
MHRVPVGVFLPTFCGPGGRSGQDVAAFARAAESLGFHSLWATDHLLHGSRFYSVPWLDPLLSLATAAAVTDRVLLGTSVLVMPVRHPVVLAKEIATLQALSGDRYILGAGTGWDAREFEAVGARKAERGRRTDEALSLVRRLLAGETVTFEGRFYRLRNVSIEPVPRRPVRVWVAGGRQLPHPSSPEPPVLSPAVLARIAEADGWIARPTAAPAQIRQDREEILAYLEAHGRDPSTLTVAHENFLHLVPTADPARARDEQRRVFKAVMGEGRPLEYLEQVYLTGSVEEIVQQLHERLAAGVQYLMLHTLVPSVDQLELWAEHLLPHLGGIQ